MKPATVELLFAVEFACRVAIDDCGRDAAAVDFRWDQALDRCLSTGSAAGRKSTDWR